MRKDDVEEAATTWPQRIFLLACAVVATVLAWNLWFMIPLMVFIWAVVAWNWETTGVGPREWHDYR